YFFFFQAEDGIRDGHVTGVQTCALPIFMNPSFNNEDICIDTMSDGKKRVNAFQNNSADEQKSGGYDHAASPGKRPSLLAIKHAPHCTDRRRLCQWNRRSNTILH